MNKAEKKINDKVERITKKTLKNLEETEDLVLATLVVQHILLNLVGNLTLENKDLEQSREIIDTIKSDVLSRLSKEGWC